MANYIPIRVSTLRGDQKINFNAYVRVAGKHILYCRAGDSFEGSQLSRLREKKLNTMYILEIELPKYEKYISENLRLAYDNSSSKPIEERGEIIQGIMQGAAEDLIDNLSDDVKYRLAVQGAKRFLEFLLSDPEALKSVLRVKQEEFSPAHHGVAVSALAIAIADELGIVKERPKQIDLLTVGCMIHDLEHEHLPFKHAYSQEEIMTRGEELYNKHSALGTKRLNEAGFYDPLITDIIRYNEERIDGSGPHEKSVDDLDPMIFIAAAANSFDHYVNHENIPAKDALKKMLVDKMGVYPLETLKALQGALKKRGMV
jgi:HD-GYP domain-containing protein (c-di-GMP phosphodiesterase class II)